MDLMLSVIVIYCLTPRSNILTGAVHSIQCCVAMEGMEWSDASLSCVMVVHYCQPVYSLVSLSKRWGK